MKTKNIIFPLRLEEIAGLLGDKDEVTMDIDGVIMLMKDKDDSKIKERIEHEMFKWVFEEWQAGNGVVVGDNKLLTETKLVNYEITARSPSIIPSIELIGLNATVSIKNDPEYTKEISEEVKNEEATKNKFKM